MSTSLRPLHLPFSGNSFKPASLLTKHASIKPYFKTDLGAVYDLDCKVFLGAIRDEVVDTVFADPPFNLNKEYGKKSTDDRAVEDYLTWCREWILSACRTLKPGGAFFLYNIPKWNVKLAAFLEEGGLEFRHWVAINIKFGLPIQGRLYPSHYSMLYYTKGKPRVFRRVRTPIETCRHCGGEIKDYGGHRGAMNPKGVNLTDVWNDIPPVRHAKYKSQTAGPTRCRRRSWIALWRSQRSRVTWLSTHLVVVAPHLPSARREGDTGSGQTSISPPSSRNG